MKFNILIKPIFILSITLFASAALHAQKQTAAAQKSLYDEIVAMDSIYFNAYNNCDMQTQESLYADNIEFYHDKGGLSTSKKDILDAIKKNICGKVTRELIKGSIEVYPINGYGAVEMGLHRFHNNQEPESNQPKEGSKFIIIWHNKNGKWEITRVISLH